MMEDADILAHWHAVAALSDLVAGADRRTVLLERPLLVTLDPGGLAGVSRADTGEALPVQSRFGYVWTSLRPPRQTLFEIVEYDEPDRRNLHAASVGVHVSAPRAVENFLDLGHFPFVHTDILGAEPHTEVKPYDVHVTEDGGEIFARRCRFFQPRGAANAEGAYEVEYIYRVPHPFCAILYKINPIQRARMDVITLFLQPVSEERVVAHMLLSMLDDSSSDAFLRSFQLAIFGQDKPILENQRPKKLPLDPRAETPARSDATSLAYRRWLAERGVSYGTIPSRPDSEQAA
jgi:phenylpropionate dioxygenase-like ring-hydroxylating dioxygenase large terminal subunit